MQFWKTRDLKTIESHGTKEDLENMGTKDKPPENRYYLTPAGWHEDKPISWRPWRFVAAAIMLVWLGTVAFAVYEAFR